MEIHTHLLYMYYDVLIFIYFCCYINIIFQYQKKSIIENKTHNETNNSHIYIYIYNMGQSPTKKAKKINNNQHILDGKKKSPLNFVDGDIHDKLFVALQKELDIDIITKLLKRGARVDNPIGAKTGKTALHIVQTVEIFTLETNWFKSKF